MPYHITWDNKGILVQVFGKTSIKEINNANGDLYGNARFDDHRYQVWNFLEADTSAITAKDAIQPAALDVAASRYKKHVKAAMIATDPQTVGLIHAYIDTSRELGSPWEFRIFPTMQDAEDWACNPNS